MTILAKFLKIVIKHLVSDADSSFIRKLLYRFIPHLALVVMAIPAAAQDLALDFAGTPSNVGGIDGALSGWRFTVNNPVAVTGLGCLDGRQVGYIASTEEVGLWDSNGNLLASCFVDLTQGEVGDWRFCNITPVILTQGVTYDVGVYGTNYPVSFFTPVNVDPNITFDDAMVGLGFTDPTIVWSTMSTASDAGYFGPNMELTPLDVPEPSTWFFIAFGIIQMACMVRAHARLKLMIAQAGDGPAIPRPEDWPVK